ncbi:hypothetical protein N7449_009675 [Penicillium cf. viridicatum]|uniref:Uncharacterized protein n=1 Tax=Penicillium cf. viridicatum TaxID=2972119 RepID=A0A9W9JB72_9EURO|nr:hypothetical protein N7449_009675 [Penicillium cf. viridicatum]
MSTTEFFVSSHGCFSENGIRSAQPQFVPPISRSLEDTDMIHRQCDISGSSPVCWTAVYSADAGWIDQRAIGNRRAI